MSDVRRPAVQARPERPGRRTHRAAPPVLVVLGVLATAWALALPVEQRVLVISAAQGLFLAVGVAGLAWLRPPRPGPWVVMLAGGGLYAAAWQALRLGAPTGALVVLCCGTYACIMLVVRATGGRRSDHAGLEWFDVALLAVAVSTVVVHLPEVVPGTGTDQRVVAWVSLQAGGSAVLVALADWVRAGARRRDSGITPLLGAVGGLLLWHAGTFLVFLRGGYAPGAVSDVVVILGWAVLTAALWHPSHTRVARPSVTDRAWVPSWVGTVAASVVLGGVTALGALGPERLQVGWVVVSALAMGGLLVARELVARRNTARAAGDPLTGLGNRTALLRRLVSHLARPDEGTALLCLVDVVDFARVNEHFGHHTGDRVLRSLGHRLAAAAPGAAVHRLAGDTFAVVVPSVSAADAAPHPVTRRLLAVASAPFQAGGAAGAVDEVGVELAVSVGEVLVAPLVALDLDDAAALDDEAVAVVQRAELALADARRHGATSARATPQVIERYRRQRRLVGELGTALVTGEVLPHYQAQVDLRTGLPVGVEALARWEHPELGLIGPGELLPAAEQLGALDQVDDVVLRRALRDLAGWRADDPVLGRLRVSVNASASSLRRADVVERVVGALTAAGLPGDALELEITESASLEHRAGLDATLAELRELGVSIAIDDFGSGYASMDYLARFRVDTIKVDRSLVARADDPSCSRVLVALVALTHDLGATVLAEGTEDFEAVAAVRALGFDVVQGYAHGRPAPRALVPGLLRALADVAEVAAAPAPPGGAPRAAGTAPRRANLRG